MSRHSSWRCWLPAAQKLVFKFTGATRSLLDVSWLRIATTQYRRVRDASALQPRRPCMRPSSLHTCNEGIGPWRPARCMQNRRYLQSGGTSWKRRRRLDRAAWVRVVSIPSLPRVLSAKITHEGAWVPLVPSPLHRRLPQGTASPLLRRSSKEQGAGWGPAPGHAPWAGSSGAAAGRRGGRHPLRRLTKQRGQP